MIDFDWIGPLVGFYQNLVRGFRRLEIIDSNGYNILQIRKILRSSGYRVGHVEMYDDRLYINMDNPPGAKITLAFYGIVSSD